jgi:Zn-dependent M16 (insulinase) family peptidase
MSQAMVSFTNQALKNVSRTHEILLLERYQAVTKDDVLAALKTHFLPLFDSSSSVAVVVTASAKASEIGEGLEGLGFEVTQKVMEVDPMEMEDSEGSETGSEASTDSR